MPGLSAFFIDDRQPISKLADYLYHLIDVRNLRLKLGLVLYVTNTANALFICEGRLFARLPKPEDGVTVAQNAAAMEIILFKDLAGKPGADLFEPSRKLCV